MLGVNRRTPIVLAELASYAQPGSHAVVVSDATPEVPPDTFAAALEVQLRTASTTDRAQLDQLGIAAYDRVIVMSESDRLPAQRAAARSLLTLLHVRDIAALCRERPDDHQRDTRSRRTPSSCERPASTTSSSPTRS